MLARQLGAGQGDFRDHRQGEHYVKPCPLTVQAPGGPRERLALAAFLGCAEDTLKLARAFTNEPHLKTDPALEREMEPWENRGISYPWPHVPGPRAGAGFYSLELTDQRETIP